MSVMIKGIEKPKNCFDCPCVDVEFNECKATKNRYSLIEDEYRAVSGEVPDWCPLEEVKDLVISFRPKKVKPRRVR